MKGEKPLLKAKVPSKWIKVMSEIADSRVKISQKKIKGTLELTCNKPNGVVVARALIVSYRKVPHIEDVLTFFCCEPSFNLDLIVIAPTTNDAVYASIDNRKINVETSLKKFTYNDVFAD